MLLFVTDFDALTTSLKRAKNAKIILQKLPKISKQGFEILLPSITKLKSKIVKIKFETLQICELNLVFAVLVFGYLRIFLFFKGGLVGLEWQLAPANPPLKIPQSPDNAFKVA